MLRGWTLVLVCGAARAAQAQPVNACESSAAYEQYRTGLYWATQRGSNAPALETAERHYHAALSQLEHLPSDSCRQELERKVLLQLRVLYQQDGLPVLPWKGWNAGRHDVQLPGLSVRAALFMTNDLAASFNDSRMRQFTAEAAFISSDLRLGGTPEPMTDFDRWQIVRAPVQRTADVGVTLRQNVLGAVRFDVRSAHTDDAQITSYYQPEQLNDTDTTELRVSYDRVIPVESLLDFGLGAFYSSSTVTGKVESLPEREEQYSAYGLALKVSRTLGPGRLTLAASNAWEHRPALPGVPQYERELSTLDLRVQYAGLGTAFFNPFAWGSFAPYRTVSEGFAVYAGITRRNLEDGALTEDNDDAYGGIHWEGPKPIALQFEVVAFRTLQSLFRPDDLVEQSDPTRSFSSLRLLALPKVRLLHMNRVAAPPLALGNAQVAELTVVFPISWEFALDGPSNYHPLDTVNHANDYAHFRVGSEFWLRSLSFEPLGGGLLLNAGFDLVHYYEIAKTQHLAHAGARLGW